MGCLAYVIRFLLLFFQLKTASLELVILRDHVEGLANQSMSSSDTNQPSVSNGPGPICRFVNVTLCDARPQAGAKSCQGKYGLFQ